jgi:hypothetical protein
MGKTYKDHPTKKQYYRNQQDDSPKKKPERKSANKQLDPIIVNEEDIVVPDTVYNPYKYFW